MKYLRRIMWSLALVATVLFSNAFVQAIQAGNTLILGYPKEITLISSFLKGWNFPVFFVS